jgi:hypothetical protein
MTVGGLGAKIVTGQGSVFGRGQPQKGRSNRNRSIRIRGTEALEEEIYFELDGRVFVEEEGEDGAECGG